METHARDATDRANGGRPDTEYALVAGLYVAALVVPVPVVALSLLVADAAALYAGSLLAVVGVTAVVGWAVSRTPGLAVGLGRRDAVWVLAALPLGWLVGAFGADAFGIDPPRILVPLAVVATAGGMLSGLLLVAMSRTRHADAALRGTTELAAWEARWPRRWRRVASGVLVGSFTLVVAGLLAVFTFDRDRGWGLYYFMLVEPR